MENTNLLILRCSAKRSLEGRKSDSQSTEYLFHSRQKRNMRFGNGQ